MPVETSNPLGSYLKDRRTRLDPAAFGFAAGRRRTPGLRREEVAQRANISPTWYTWLEQGRGGAPSADVLEPDRARADADRHRARASVPARARASARGPLHGGRRRHAPPAAPARCARCQPRLDQDRDLGRRRMESRRGGGADRLRRAASRPAQHPAPDLRRSPRPRRAI